MFKHISRAHQPNTHDWIRTSTMVYVPQDIVDLIIDQLCSTTLYCGSFLRATSLVSTAWVNPSQRHLFSTLRLYSSSSVRKWCSRIRPGPHGISRHVRVLQLSSRLVVSGTLETALPHFTSFRNLRELDIAGDAVRQNRIGILVPLLLVRRYSQATSMYTRLAEWCHSRLDMGISLFSRQFLAKPHRDQPVQYSH